MSSVSSVAASALVGAFNRFDAAAARGVQAASGGGDGLAEASVEMSQAKAQAGVAAAVMRTADQMTGTLLDILA